MKIDKSYKVGDTVRYETFTGELRTVRVTAKLYDIKNGRPGFDGVEVSSSRHLRDLPDVAESLPVWGYNSQILRVFCQEQKRWKGLVQQN